MVKMRGCKAVVEALKAENVKLVFGLPGGHSLAILYDALHDVPEIKTVLVRHEQAASFMAYAYGKLTGQPGICHGTVGPGVQNLVTGIAEAWAGCIPLIAICPSVLIEYEGKGALQEFPQIPMLASFTKWSVRVDRADKIPWAMRRAFQVAATGKPGPVYIEIPVDIGQEVVDIPGYRPSKHPLRSSGDPREIEKAVDKVLKAERPVIVAGGGTYLSRAFEELREFAELLGIPVLTSASGKGAISENHPLSAGLIGIYRTKVSKKVWEETDLIISIGCRFEEVESAGWSWFPKETKFIQVDIDPNEIGRNWVPDVAIVGDAKLVLEGLMKCASEKIKKTNFSEMPRVRNLIKAKKEYEAEILSLGGSSAVPIKPLHVIREMRAAFNRDAILVHEHGSLDFWAYSRFPVLEPGACVAPASQTCMGLGVAGAIGAKLTKPNRQVISITGDGAFQMLMHELPTAVQYKAPVIWCIMNNFSLGWIKYIQKLFYGERYISVNFEVQPDFVKIAEASKCYGERVEKLREVKDALKAAVKANDEGTPAVLDFIVDPWDLPEGFVEYHNRMLMH